MFHIIRTHTKVSSNCHGWIYLQASLSMPSHTSQGWDNNASLRWLSKSVWNLLTINCAVRQLSTQYINLRLAKLYLHQYTPQGLFGLWSLHNGHFDSDKAQGFTIASLLWSFSWHWYHLRSSRNVSLRRTIHLLQWWYDCDPISELCAETRNSPIAEKGKNSTSKSHIRAWRCRWVMQSWSTFVRSCGRPDFVHSDLSPLEKSLLQFTSTSI